MFVHEDEIDEQLEKNIILEKSAERKKYGISTQEYLFDYDENEIKPYGNLQSTF